MTKQEDRVLDYMEKHNWVTNVELINKLGIGSPTKVISDMIKNGVAIEKEPGTGLNRYGEKVHFTRYRLADY